MDPYTGPLPEPYELTGDYLPDFVRKVRRRFEENLDEPLHQSVLEARGGEAENLMLLAFDLDALGEELQLCQGARDVFALVLDGSDMSPRDYFVAAVTAGVVQVMYDDGCHRYDDSASVIMQEDYRRRGLSHLIVNGRIPE